MNAFLFLFLIININSLDNNLRGQNNNDLLKSEELSDDIIILHTNDVHCGIQDTIGYDGLMLYKKELKKKYKYVLTVDVGDHIQGDIIGLLSKGVDIISIMNEVGYDVAILGNHEFDYGLEALENCSKLLKCGYICSNFCYRKNKAPIYKPYVIKEVGDKKIAFISVLTPLTFLKSFLHTVTDDDGELLYDFLTANENQDLYDRVQEHIDKVRSEGADYVIILDHMGDDEDPNNIHTSIRLISHISGVDAMLDAHTHKVYTKKVKDKNGKEIFLSQTGTKLYNIGVLKIQTDGKITSELVSEVPEPDDKEGAIKVVRNNKERWVDEEMNKFLKKIEDSHSGELNDVIGYSDFDLIINTDPNKDHHKHLTRVAESALGDLVTDAMRNAGKSDVAIITGGSIRNDIHKGNITSLNALSVLPYSNKIMVKEVTGQDILDAVELGMKVLPEFSPRFIQVSGISFKVDLSIPSPVVVDENDMFIKINGKRRVSEVKIGNEDLILDKKYKIALEEYTSNGGGGFTMFTDYEEIDLQILDNESLIKYIKENLNGKIPDSYKNTQGRIRKTNNKDNDKDDDKDDDKNNGNYNVLIVVIISIVTLSLVAVFIFIVIKKKRNEGTINTSDVEPIDENLVGDK
jgi:2',3'-cyclic-nucleotide 2'-phosphodiesterase (5'-nucleotidase family)